ncbi:MAG: hypothetical protein D6691_01465 [Candidatus Hydrogenedentota bacterium]|nr:MAG: hypothetical protein D6691_01465 [Candidatus Hydrogenedentota bacterium]GIX45203.1 MAG: xanthan lyase [Candidatus Sumerlaea sp.]
MSVRCFRYLWLLMFLLLGGHATFSQPQSSPPSTTGQSTAPILEVTTGPLATILPTKTKVVRITPSNAFVEVEFSPRAVERPWRPSDVQALKNEVARQLGRTSSAEIRVVVGGRPIEDYVPPAYRAQSSPRCGPTTASPHAKTPLVERVRPGIPKPTHGLAGRHIVVWASHGRYYAETTQQWEWQRPRMFTTVEDLLTMSIVNNYLIPMLENAGAVVISCRERDYQVNEVVVDDEDGGELRSGGGGFVRATGFRPSAAAGFRSGFRQYDEKVNPHTLGRSHEWQRGFGQGSFEWIPRIPADGDYAVYVSYAGGPDRATNALYRVHHTGGTTEFRVNQQMMGNMWVYLGTFRFASGVNSDRGRVELVAASDTNGTLSADAVKIGGGMGNVARNGQISGYPRYAEGAWYWFQYSGAELPIFYPAGKDEYMRDYASRPEFVNYLLGAPRGPAANPAFGGKGVPVDLAFALHTDAGIATGTVGTLSIYKLRGEDKQAVFPDGRDRMLSRDLADLVQTQIVEDIRALYCSSWTRRDLAERDLAEARRPHVPTVLIELLSHQNYDDMKFMLDPRFKRDVARAIYKGMLRFLATEYGFEPVPTPLPPRLLGAFARNGKVRIVWNWTNDPLEPRAHPTAFVLYRRVGNGGWDNGTLVGDGNTTSVEVPLISANPWAIESFALSAINEGGESLLSDELSVCVGKPAPRALIVNAFTRLCGPAMESGRDITLSSAGTYAREGVNRQLDRGVTEGWHAGLTGDQYDFDRNHAWVGEDTPFNNAQPGHGASFGDLETTQVLGKPRDLVRRHGQAFADCQWGFDSVTAEAIPLLDPAVTRQQYAAVDWILGEQRTTLPPPAHAAGQGEADRMQPAFQTWPAVHRDFIQRYLAAGGKLIASGSYIATDLVLGPGADAAGQAFLKNTLRCKWTTDHASKSRNLLLTLEKETHGTRFYISSGIGEDGVYAPSAVGGVANAAKDGVLWLRYEDSGVGAAVAARSGNGEVVVMAFPLECVTGERNRASLLQSALNVPLPPPQNSSAQP